MKPNRASKTPRAATSTAPSWRAIHRAKTRAARRAVVIDRFDASRADRKEFRLNGLPDLAGYELDQPHNRIISLGVWAPFPSAVNVAGVRISNARQIADIAAKHRIPAIGYKEKEYVRTPQQDLAYARWAKCNAPFVQLEWVALDGRITFRFSTEGGRQEVLQCLAEAGRTGPPLPEPVGVRPPGGP